MKSIGNLRWIFLIYTCFLLMYACSEPDDQVIVFECSDAVSYSSDIIPIMNTYCAFSGCHAGQFAWGDFGDYNQIKSRTETVYTKVYLNNTMPPAESSGPVELTSEELEKLECWINNGAPNN